MAGETGADPGGETGADPGGTPEHTLTRTHSPPGLVLGNSRHVRREDQHRYAQEDFGPAGDCSHGVPGRDTGYTHEEPLKVPAHLPGDPLSRGRDCPAIPLAMPCIRPSPWQYSDETAAVPLLPTALIPTAPGDKAAGVDVGMQTSMDSSYCKVNT